MTIVCIFSDICMNLPDHLCPIPIHWIIFTYSVLHYVYMGSLTSLFLVFFSFQSCFGWFQGFSSLSVWTLTAPCPEVCKYGCIVRRTEGSFLLFWWHQECTFCWVCFSPLSLPAWFLLGIQIVTLESIQRKALYKNAQVLPRLKTVQISSQSSG